MEILEISIQKTAYLSKIYQCPQFIDERILSFNQHIGFEELFILLWFKFIVLSVNAVQLFLLYKLLIFISEHIINVLIFK